MTLIEISIDWLDPVIAIAAGMISSAGFWAFLQSRGKKADAKTKLLLGLAHEKIISVGKRYIEQGFLTYDEYEDFMNYLWEPYATFGGNGLAERVVSEVKKLPVVRQGIKIASKETVG